MQLQIGSIILRARRARGLTQEALAEQVGISAAAVSKWETGVSLRQRYHTNPTLTFAQPIQPEGWITRKGGMRPVEG